MQFDRCPQPDFNTNEHAKLNQNVNQHSHAYPITYLDGNTKTEQHSHPNFNPQPDTHPGLPGVFHDPITTTSGAAAGIPGR